MSLVSFSDNQALIVVDVQKDFCPGGALPVPDGDAVVPVINTLMTKFSTIVASKDWHPVGHISFASSHEDKDVLDQIETRHGTQTLWPDHCVQNTAGASLHPDLNQEPIDMILHKGKNQDIDSYSAFRDNAEQHRTGLKGFLQERSIDHVFIAGLALDYCVLWTARDAQEQGFEVRVIVQGCRAIAPQEEALRLLQEAKIKTQTFDL